MRRLLVSFIVLFTLIFSYTILAQQYWRARSGIEISIPVKLQKAVLDPLPAGTYTIGAGGYFATITDAFNKLSIDGIGGEVTLELIDTLYVAPTDSFGFKLVGPIPGAGPNSRVILKPAANKNVVLQGNGRYVIYFFNTSYLNFDGVSTDGETTLTIYSIYNSLFDLNRATRFSANSDHNIIQNLTCIGEDLYRYGDLIVFGAVDNSSAPDSNLIQNNFIKKGGGSIVIGGFSSSRRAMGNIVRNNKIGSQTDSLISWGIQLENCQNTIVENNIVQNMKVTTNVGDIFIPGINSLWGNGDIIRNNTVYNINPSKGYSSVGILLSGLSGEFGNNNQVYNNVVYDINSTSTQYDSRVTGIQMWYQNNPKIYYNSVYLSGTGANKYGSAALYISLACYNVDVKNNIFVNTRDESPYCASAIYGVSSGILTDYNNLYYEPNQNNCLVRIGSTDYNTLAEWQAMGQDINSVSKAVNFVSATDLHLTGLSNGDIDLIATPIAGITTDIDGDTRNALHPYKGADEASVALPVELTSFTAEALDQKIILKWTTSTELNNNGFEIQRKITESEFATIGFVKGEGTTTNQKQYSYIDKDLVDGKYFYRLKQVDYNGSYEYSDVIEVDVRTVDEFVLEQNFPNPFNPTTTIGYILKEKSSANLTLLNVIGEEIAVLVNEEQDKGFHKVDFNAANLPSGVYFYQLRAGDFVQTRKMILLK